MTLHDYARILKRFWWIIAIATILGGLGGAGVAAVTPPTYSAGATVYVGTTNSDSLSDLQQGNTLTTQRAATYADLAETTAVLSQARSALGGDVTVDGLRSSIASKAREDTSLIDITATGSSPSRVADESNAVATALVEQAANLDGSTAPGLVTFRIVQGATEPDDPLAPAPKYLTLIGAVIGFALGIVIVVLVTSVDSRIRSAVDLPRTAALTSSTSIPRRGSRRRGEARSEAFRNLRANLQLGADAGPSIAVVGVTTAVDTVDVARHLAESLVEGGSRVVVVEAVARRSDSGEGLAAVLRGTAPLDDAMVSDPAGFAVIPAGSGIDDAVKHASILSLRSLVSQLSEAFDYVLVAGPPVVARADAAVIAAIADDCLLVVAAGSTTRSEVLFGLELLAGVNVEAISVALDGVRGSDLGARRVRQPEISAAT